MTQELQSSGVKFEDGICAEMSFYNSRLKAIGSFLMLLYQHGFQCNSSLNMSVNPQHELEILGNVVVT